MKSGERPEEADDMTSKWRMYHHSLRLVSRSVIVKPAPGRSRCKPIPKEIRNAVLIKSGESENSSSLTN
jgi:hypothetical protein